MGQWEWIMQKNRKESVYINVRDKQIVLLLYLYNSDLIQDWGLGNWK